MDFGKLISERRKELGLTLEQVGNACGVGKSTVRKWETGMIQNVGRDKIRDLAAILRIDPTQLIDLNDDHSSAQEDAWAIRDKLRADPELRVLFDAADGAKPEHLRAAVAMLRQTVSESASTYYPARDCKVLLSHLFKLAGADGWVSKDLPSYIILPDLHEKERCPFLPEEQAALWRLYESGNKDAAIPLLMIYTGMMPGEVMRMTPAMIHMEDHQIIGAGLKTKVRQESPIWLPDAVIPILDAALADPGHPLWLKSEKPLYLHYYAALEAAGTRRLEPYCCRHTTATALTITENIAPQTVQRIMRWANSRMLDRYAHPDEEAILSAVNTIGRTTDLLPTEAAAAIEKP